MNTTVIGALCFILVLAGLFVFLATKKSDFNKDEEPSQPKPESIPTPDNPSGKTYGKKPTTPTVES